MIKYLRMLRKELKKVSIKEEEKMKEEKQLTSEEVGELLGISLTEVNLKKADSKGKTSYIMDDKIYFLPPSYGYPRCTYKFYQNNKLIIDNQTAFSQITNLDEILIKMVEIYDKALDSDIVLDPYSFGLKLTNQVKKSYIGKAELLMTEEAIRNNALNEDIFEEAKIYFLNLFLDDFICENFGITINKNEELKEKLNEFNQKVISLNLRETNSSQHEAFNDEENGIQHYYLPDKKEKVRKLNKQ